MIRIRFHVLFPAFVAAAVGFAAFADRGIAAETSAQSRKPNVVLIITGDDE